MRLYPELRFLGLCSGKTTKFAMTQKILPRKLHSQSRAVVDSLRTLLLLVFLEHRPADRSLAGYLRQHKEYGARDRRLISDSIFAVFRWWGWLRFFLCDEPACSLSFSDSDCVTDMISPALADKLTASCGDETPAFHMTVADCARILLVAHILDDLELPPVADVWAEKAGVNIRDMLKVAGDDDNPENAVTALHQLVVNGEKNDVAFTFRQLVPRWLADEVVTGVDVFHLVTWLQKRVPLWVRLQEQSVGPLIEELTQAGVKVCQHSSVPNARRIVPDRVNLYQLPAYKRGAFEIQDVSSQCTGLVCDPAPRTRWWDACAGGGGKTLQLAVLMERTGTVVASDIREYKLKDVKKRARRASLPNIELQHWNGGKPDRKRSLFDGVLVDAPCTCSGVWRRNPEGRWLTARSEIQELHYRQCQILNNASLAVKEKGRLVYATCSIFKKENEDVVNSFLAANPGFELVPFPHPLTNGQTDGTLQIYPWETDSDAMFIARFRRIR